MLEQAGPIRTSSSWTVRRALILSTSNPDHQLLETSNTCGMRMTERDDDRRCRLASRASPRGPERESMLKCVDKDKTAYSSHK